MDGEGRGQVKGGGAYTKESQIFGEILKFGNVAWIIPLNPEKSRKIPKNPEKSSDGW